MMKLMRMKYKNWCRKCGKSLPIGHEAYMGKNATTGKWEFDCLDCHSLPINQNYTAVTLKPSITSELAEALGLMEDTSNEEPKEPEGLLEKLKLSAKWRLSA